MAASITISDFGPVAHAEVDIKPLSILIGPNGSGKSYVALAIYSLTRAIGESVQPLRFRSPVMRRASMIRGLAGQERRQIAAVLESSASEIQQFLLGEANLQQMPMPVRDLVGDQWRRLTGAMGGTVDYELRRCLGMPLDDLGRRNRKIDRGEFELKVRNESTGFSWGMRCRNDELVMTSWEPGSSIGLNSTDPERVPSTEALLHDPDHLYYLVMEAYSRHSFSEFSGRSHYLPASRSGILQGHRTLTSLIVGRASRAWIEPMDIATLPGVITDLIEGLLELGRPSLRSVRFEKPRFEGIVEFLESNVTKGSVDVENLADYPDITYHNEAGQFKLHAVSSMVSEIAPLILFLKYLIRPGDLFIFEEPESHLDPENQGNLARAIAMMVNAGIKVLVTTHSDFFVSQLNNLLMLSRVAPRRRPRRRYGKNEILEPDKVGAYWFEASEEGTVVQELDVTGEYGIPTFSFADTHRDLYDEAIALEHLPRG